MTRADRWELLLTCLVAACAPWPHAARVPPLTSGLIGDWAGLPAWSNGDTVVWHFDARGVAYRVRMRSQSVEREPFGAWWVYADSSARRRFVCFEYGRERARPTCWYFTIDTVVDESGQRRELQLLGRVGDGVRAPEAYVTRGASSPH